MIDAGEMMVSRRMKVIGEEAARQQESSYSDLDEGESKNETGGGGDTETPPPPGGCETIEAWEYDEPSDSWGPVLYHWNGYSYDRIS